jgi:glutathione synthase/RimK-type ligase-like ATP-grasp enzyme
MNERIKELAEQATINIGDKFHPIDFFDKEKFAELIVKECILVIEENAEHIHAEGTVEAIVNLEKHFGVE